MAADVGSLLEIRRTNMAKPPPSGPHSDIKGVNMDARVNAPNRDPAKGNADDLENADTESVGRPDVGEVSPEDDAAGS
jgi:hypothetical protein